MAKDNDNKKKGINPLAAAAVGVAVGATAATLANKENREKLKEKAGELKEKAQKRLVEAQKKVQDAREISKIKLAKQMDKTSKKLKKQSS